MVSPMRKATAKPTKQATKARKDSNRPLLTKHRKTAQIAFKAILLCIWLGCLIFKQPTKRLCGRCFGVLMAWGYPPNLWMVFLDGALTRHPKVYSRRQAAIGLIVNDKSSHRARVLLTSRKRPRSSCRRMYCLSAGQAALDSCAAVSMGRKSRLGRNRPYSAPISPHPMPM